MEKIGKLNKFLRTLKLTHQIVKHYKVLIYTMSESQSRYSIVERLTRKKLEIMSSRSNLKQDVKSKEQVIDKLKKDLENWKKDIQEDIKREQRKMELDIERVIQEFNNSKEQLKDKENVYNEQIVAIEDALKSIEEISKTSPTNSP